MTAKICGSGISAPVQPVAQRPAAHELQDDVVGVADLLEVVDLDEVGMAGPRHDLRLLEEALQRGRVGGGRQDQLLDRDLAAEARLLGQVDGAHAAAPELALDPVLADVALARGLGGVDRGSAAAAWSAAGPASAAWWRRRGRRNVLSRHGGRRSGRRRWRGSSAAVTSGGARRRASPRRRDGWRRRPGLRFPRLTGLGHLARSLAEWVRDQYHAWRTRCQAMAFWRHSTDNLARTTPVNSRRRYSCRRCRPPPPGQPAPMGGTPSAAGSNKKTCTRSLPTLLWLAHREPDLSFRRQGRPGRQVERRQLDRHPRAVCRLHHLSIIGIDHRRSCSRPGPLWWIVWFIVWIIVLILALQGSGERIQAPGLQGHASPVRRPAGELGQVTDRLRSKAPPAAGPFFYASAHLLQRAARCRPAARRARRAAGSPRPARARAGTAAARPRACQLAHPRIGAAGSCLRTSASSRRSALERHLELTPLGEQLLDQRLRRLCRLFRHSDRVRAGTRAAGGAPSRRAGSAP